jgi:hypothetical protein
VSMVMILGILLVIVVPLGIALLVAGGDDE